MALAMSRLRVSESRPGSLPKLVESPAGPPKFLGRIMTPVYPRSAVATPAARSKSSGLEFIRSRQDHRVEIVDMDGIEILDFDDDGDDESDDDETDGGVDARTRAERAAEFEVAHNWLLKEETAIQAKKFDRTKRKLAICLPDDDPLEGISNRLEEIQSMVKPKVELSGFLEELQPEQRERILKITNMGYETVKSLRRKNWRKQDMLRHIFRMAYIMSVGANKSRRYFNPDDPEAGPAVMRKQRQLYKKGKHQMIKSSLSVELQEVMQTNPIYRTTDHVKRVTWLLKTTKAFKHLFPTEMIEEVAKVVAYERYDDNRHISYQGRPPERFYYVLAGRIHKLREYKLTSGCVNKPMGFMHKGFTSDPEEMENQWSREYHLVAKGPVEVLILFKDDFIRLQHTTQGPPVDFLYSIELFKEFPCEMFIDNEDAIDYKYYGQNKVITADVNRTPWLHVVKSGNVKVVRKQQVVDTRNNDTKFQSRSTDELGCGRSFSHAKAMLGNLTSQRKMKDMADFSLPELMRRRSTTLIEEGMRGGRKLRKHTLKLTAPIIREMPSRETDRMDDNNGSTQEAKKDFSLPPIVVSDSEPQHSRSGHSSNTGTPRQVKTDRSSPSSKPETKHSADVPLQPHGTFLTREKTAAEIEAMFKPKKVKKEIPLRKTCVQLDLLKPGDVFGLEEVAHKFRFLHQESDTGELSRITGKDLGLETLDLPTIQKFEGPALNLVSDGAEVIKISKRFFLQHAQNNTMLRVETMQRSYLTTDEAKDILYDKETWGQYKEALMKRLIQGLPGMHDSIKKA